MRAYFTRKPLEIAERFWFHKRNQGAEETVAQYVAAIKGLLEQYKFGASLEDTLGQICLWIKV